VVSELVWYLTEYWFLFACFFFFGYEQISVRRRDLRLGNADILLTNLLSNIGFCTDLILIFLRIRNSFV